MLCELRHPFGTICRKCGIKVSVENLFAGNTDGELLPVLGDAGEITEFVESLESDCFNVCIDVGHSNITGYNPAEVLSKVGSKHLRALHIHDNSGINDEHTLPYNGKIQWLAITDALTEIGCEGEFTFEVFSYLDKISPALMPSALKYVCDIGRFLISEIKK